MAVTVIYGRKSHRCSFKPFIYSLALSDWEIGMREPGGPEMAAFSDLL